MSELWNLRLKEIDFFVFKKSISIFVIPIELTDTCDVFFFCHLKTVEKYLGRQMLSP